MRQVYGVWFDVPEGTLDSRTVEDMFGLMLHRFAQQGTADLSTARVKSWDLNLVGIDPDTGEETPPIPVTRFQLSMMVEYPFCPACDSGVKGQHHAMTCPNA